MKKELLFYEAYEQFYAMAATSKAFQDFCRDAYGQDFSQDGFSDIHQVNRILPYVSQGAHVLDVGCGNGKMLRYLQQKTGAAIHGFDYSEQAIGEARAMHLTDAYFTVGVMGEIDYLQEQFDVVTSMDSMYFAPDMAAFAAQIKGWLKTSGVLCVGYQEGDVMPRTSGPHDTVLAKALRKNGMPYQLVDLTMETYDLMHRKRETALRYQAALEAEGHAAWFQLLMAQTDHCLIPPVQYRARYARYFYTAQKG